MFIVYNQSEELQLIKAYELRIFEFADKINKLRSTLKNFNRSPKELRCIGNEIEFYKDQIDQNRAKMMLSTSRIELRKK